MRRTIAVLLLLAAMPLFAERDPARYDRVLLPFSGGIAGGAGFWDVRWWFRNDGDTPVDVFPLAVGCGLCPPAFKYYVVGPLPPRTTPLVLGGDVLPGPLFPYGVPIAPTPPGVLLYVERGKGGQLSISGFLGRSDFAGLFRRSVSSALRPIHESRLLQGRHSIFAAPAAGARATIRVYALPETVQGGEVTVRTFTVPQLTVPSSTEQLVVTSTVRFVTTTSDDGLLEGCISPCDVPHVPYKPAVAELDLTAALASPAASAIRVEIETNARWWAVLSVTSATEDVQLFEPSDLR